MTKNNFAGGGPTASYLSCLAKKGNPKKSPPVCRPCGVPSISRKQAGLRTGEEGGIKRVLKVEIQTGEIPDVFVRFRDVIDERYWLKRLSFINKATRGHQFLKNYLIEENAIAIALARCSNLVAQYGRIPMHETENRDLYPAIKHSVLNNTA